MVTFKMAATKWFNKDGQLRFLQQIQTFGLSKFSAVQSQTPDTDEQCVLPVASSKYTPKQSLN